MDRKIFQTVSEILRDAGLSIDIVGMTAVAGLVSSEALNDPKDPDDEITADDAFEFFDVDGDGSIQRGDIE